MLEEQNGKSAEEGTKTKVVAKGDWLITGVNLLFFYPKGLATNQPACHDELAESGTKTRTCHSAPFCLDNRNYRNDINRFLGDQNLENRGNEGQFVQSLL
jgi:hypothetical protein